MRPGDSFTARILSAITGLAMLAFLPFQAQAFDAGHHFDQSETALLEAGFSADARNSVAMANWLTDYYSNAPASENFRLRSALSKLHFDDLPDAKSVGRYYGWLMHNLRTQTIAATRKQDRIHLLTVMGVGLHVMQDFYSHSNWSDLHPRRKDGSFDADLFPRLFPNPLQTLRTGHWPQGGETGHGGYFDGMNKDSPVRKGWENAHVMATEASRILVRQFRQWVEETSPAFWQETLSLELSRLNRRQLQRDLKSAKDVSMWVKTALSGYPAADGHWKGNSSGDSRLFTAAVAEFTGWKNSFITRYFRTSKIPEMLADRLYSTRAPPKHARVSNRLPDRQAVIVKIHEYALLKDTASFRGVGATIKIEDRTYAGKIITGLRKYAAQELPAWIEIHLTGEETGTTGIEISLNAITPNGTPDKLPLDIGFANNHRSLRIVYDLERRRITGDINQNGITPLTRIRTAGTETNSAAIIFSVEHHEVD